MTIYSEPPAIFPFERTKPTLLVCWWITIFCTTIIFFRVSGRYVRTERLFPEDRTAALAIIPLFLRMGCVHVILLYGTNNADFSNVELSEEEVRRRQIGSGLVLASRIFYAATLWILKLASLEFFQRLIGVTWKKTYTRLLFYIRCTIIATFIAIIISDLAECQPFSHYWQILPDPGGQCRQGYAQLITMATCNILTDLLLVFFPIPIILRSFMTVKRKVQLVTLFSLGLVVVGTTLYRVPHVFDAHGRQQLRSLLASVELLFATTTANALVLGSFVRDRGVKKKKFKQTALSDTMDRAGGHGPPRMPGTLNRPMLHRHWGSDEDLVRDLGISLGPELRNEPYRDDSDDEEVRNHRKYTPAPPVAPDMSHWRFPGSHRHSGGSGSSTQKHASFAEGSDASLLARENSMTPSPMASRSNSTASPRKVSFFDVGGLLDDAATLGRGGVGDRRRESYHSSIDPLSPPPFPPSMGANLNPSLTASGQGFRRGSTTFLQDLGGLLPTSQGRHHRSSRSSRSAGTELQPIPQGRPGGIPDLADVGGLLDPQGQAQHQPKP